MNDQEIEKMLLETYKISRENREYLRRIEGRQKIAHMGKYIKAALLIAVIIVGCIYVSPHLAEIQSLFESVQKASETIQTITPASLTP